MSLVDYASSDEEEDHNINIQSAEEEEEEEEEEPKVSAQVAEEKRQYAEASIDQSPASEFHPPISPNTQHYNQRSGTTVNGQGEKVSKELETPALKLPDATFLLSSPVLTSHVANANDHSSRVAAAMAESASRKRDLNGSSSSSYTRQKVPRGNLPHLKRVPDAIGGNLLPPQLTGRSNIVTEDVSKLFVKKHVNSSSK